MDTVNLTHSVLRLIEIKDIEHKQKIKELEQRIEQLVHIQGKLITILDGLAPS